MAIVLATSYDDPNSDAVVASAVSVLNQIHAQMHIVAECLNPKHRALFDSVHCDAVVFSMQISGNLLAQEVHDPGIAQLLDTITSNSIGTTLYSTRVPHAISLSYQELARKMLDAGVNMVCVNRARDCVTCFRDMTPQPDDRIVYIGTQRWDWDELRHALQLQD
jgi:voltage-gated potassium channel